MKLTKEEIGKKVMHTFKNQNGATFEVMVIIEDVKVSFGRRRWLVHPLGQGKKPNDPWIYAHLKPKYLS